MIGLYCLNEHYDWPEELLKVKRGTRGLGKCLTQENKEDGCHGNVKASRSVCVWGGGGLKYQRCGITQWRSWSRLPKWMSAHEVDLKSLKHICFSLACILSVFVSIFLILFFYFFLYYSFSVMVLTQLAFALAIFIFTSMLIICNFFFF